MTPAERAAAERERLRDAGRALGRAAGPLPADQAARVAAILTPPANSTQPRRRVTS